LTVVWCSSIEFVVVTFDVNDDNNNNDDFVQKACVVQTSTIEVAVLF